MWHHRARKLRSVIAKPKHVKRGSVNKVKSGFCPGRRSFSGEWAEMRPRSRTKRSGFSLLAVLFGVAAITIILGVALPSMTNAIANVKLRASMTSVSGLLQNTRMLAVKLNRTMTARYLVRTTSPLGLVYYAKSATDSSALTGSNPQVELEAPITRYTNGSQCACRDKHDHTRFHTPNRRSVVQFTRSALFVFWRDMYV